MIGLDAGRFVAELSDFKPLVDREHLSHSRDGVGPSCAINGAAVETSGNGHDLPANILEEATGYTALPAPEGQPATPTAKRKLAVDKDEQRCVTQITRSRGRAMDRASLRPQRQV